VGGAASRMPAAPNSAQGRTYPPTRGGRKQPPSIQDITSMPGRGAGEPPTHTLIRHSSPVPNPLSEGCNEHTLLKLRLERALALHGGSACEEVDMRGSDVYAARAATDAAGEWARRHPCLALGALGGGEGTQGARARLRCGDMHTTERRVV